MNRNGAANKFEVTDPFWSQKLAVNAEKAIYHQWEQLVKTGCIENFRLVTGDVEGVRLGYFFADSDAYKWLDAAARVYGEKPSEKLKTLMDGFIELIGRVQADDGYIFTYNQFFFPDVRWVNLQIEHELYCHGHLIEAGVSHFEATGERRLLEICTRAADLLVDVFMEAGPEGTPGHQEIEIALIRLFEITGTHPYLDLAGHFLKQRGRVPWFFPHILGQNNNVEARGKHVEAQIEAYQTANPEHAKTFQLPPDNASAKPPWGTQRWLLNTASGKYFQQHKPVERQTIPVGHAVRFTYLETAAAMLYQHQHDPELMAALEQAWDRMVNRRMYVTGGIGSLPNTEGFGRDYELDPQYSYSETCAALGNMLWNWEMTKITKMAKYADLFEWQLYNAAAVGLGQDGTSYLYNNPLFCADGMTRAEWFKCPCCPSNVSRVWADLGKYIYSADDEAIWVHQYVGGKVSGGLETGGRRVQLAMSAGLPWDGQVRIQVDPETSGSFAMQCRVPGWASGVEVKVNGEAVDFDVPPAESYTLTASGFDPDESWYLPVARVWKPGDVLEISFDMGINVRATHHKVKATLGQVAVTCGPFVYCLESLDNPGVNIFGAKLDPGSLYAEVDPELFGGVTVIRGETVDGKALTFIPYYLWANRGESQMTVYVAC